MTSERWRSGQHPAKARAAYRRGVGDHAPASTVRLRDALSYD